MKTLHLLLLLLAAAVANCFTPAGADLIITTLLCALAVPVAVRMDRGGAEVTAQGAPAGWPVAGSDSRRRTNLKETTILWKCTETRYASALRSL